MVIDETREADARVPEEFLRAQWTWLPGGETPPAFAQRVRQLLGIDPAPAPAAKVSGNGSRSSQAPEVPVLYGHAVRRVVRRCRTPPHCTAAGSGRWGFLVLPRRERRACCDTGTRDQRRFFDRRCRSRRCVDCGAAVRQHEFRS